METIHTPYHEALVKRLIRLREGAGLNQRELAKRLRRVPSVVAHIELGQRRVDIVELFFLCLACDADAEKITTELIREFKALSRTGKGSSSKNRG